MSVTKENKEAGDFFKIQNYSDFGTIFFSLWTSLFASSKFHLFLFFPALNIRHNGATICADMAQMLALLVTND